MALDGGHRLRQRCEIRGARREHIGEDRLDAVVATHEEERLRGEARVLEPDRDGLAAGGRNTPAGLRELALLEVADRIRGVAPVALEERAEQQTVGRRAGFDRAFPPADREGRHQRATASAASVALAGAGENG
jgi:hypothetical protein